MNNTAAIQLVLLFLLMSQSITSFKVIAKKPEFIIELKDHLFHPSELIIPSNQKVKLLIYNRDDTPEEFDSFDLNREKVMFPHKKTVIFIGPLSAGTYKFFGEFNPNSAKGLVLVKDENITTNPKTLLNGGRK